MFYVCIANKEEGALVVKPGPFNFNYWKRTEKSGSDTSFFYFFYFSLDSYPTSHITFAANNKSAQLL